MKYYTWSTASENRLEIPEKFLNVLGGGGVQKIVGPI